MSTPMKRAFFRAKAATVRAGAGAFHRELLANERLAPDGAVRTFGCTYRGMDYPNQDILCRGVVTKKYVDGSHHLVDLEIWTENPSGQKTSPGSGTVTLPARG